MNLLSCAVRRLAPRAMRMLTHLERLEAESVHIFREVVAEAENPVMLHLASGWDFADLLAHRDKTVRDYGLKLIVARNEDADAQGINPFDTGSALYSPAQLPEPLKQALTAHGFDAAFGGGRRDEEKARAKERIFSFRSAAQRWDPKNQRPELWNLYNAKKAKGESIRVFPISNWTELDIWQYIALEKIDIVPLYFSKPRPTVERGALILVVDDGRFRLEPGEQPVMRSVRFRTLGCYPLTSATQSTATDMNLIIQEMLLATSSERRGRATDQGQSASMEDKKQARLLLMDTPSRFRTDALIAEDIDAYLHQHQHKSLLCFITREARAAMKNQRPRVLWFTGLSGSGKSTIANEVKNQLNLMNRNTFLLDGDDVRHWLNRDLGFTEADRIEIFVDTPLEVAEARDVKGLYKNARSGQLKNFTGIGSPYEPPEHPEVRVNTVDMSPEDAARFIIQQILPLK